MEYRLEGADVLILSIVVLFAGTAITRRVSFLKKNSIPEAVTGGLHPRSPIDSWYLACYSIPLAADADGWGFRRRAK